MPTHRKRIGFLPRVEVHDLINEICELNKLSQSKVTGILVEEALNNRGAFEVIKVNDSEKLSYNKEKLLFKNKERFDNQIQLSNENNNLDQNYMEDEVQMINDYIEYKLFKNIMKKRCKN